VSRARLVEGEGYPDPPVNVRIVFGDGDEVPVDCTYAGWDRQEQSHLWVVINPRPFELPIEILIHRMPPHTSITVEGGIE
jgi:hypothetical protein